VEEAMNVRVVKRFLVALIGGMCLSCTSDPAFWSGVAAGLAEAAAPGYSSSDVFPSSPELLLFGGGNHDKFLGCLNCAKYETSSLHNKYSDFGNRYSSDSIFNKYGDFGSKYSATSACNPYATDPPAVVDRQGNFYGYLTLNRYNSQVRNSAIVAWLAGVCSDR
jgi:hypothetical protein